MNGWWSGAGWGVAGGGGQGGVISPDFPLRVDFRWEALNPIFGAQDEVFSEFRST